MESDRLSRQCHQLESELCESKLHAISGGSYPIGDDQDGDEEGGRLLALKDVYVWVYTRCITSYCFTEM